MALPVFRSSAITPTPASVASSQNCPVPAGAAINDIAVMAVYRENTNTIAASGFTLLGSVDATDHRLSILWKRLTAADTGNYTATFAATSAWTDCSVCLFSGCVLTGSPWDPAWVTGFNNTVSNTMPSLSFTTGSADEMLVYVGANFGGAASWITPSGMTLRVNSTTLDHMVASLGQAAAGATGAKQGTKTGSTGRSTAFLGGLLPVTAVSPKQSAFMPFFS